MQLVLKTSIMNVFSCFNKSAEPSPCEPGEFSLSGASQCENCSKGFMCPDSKMHSQLPCVNGTFANKTRSTVCKTCPVGYECLDPRETPSRCSEGYYSVGGTTLCVRCPAGHR